MLSREEMKNHMVNKFLDIHSGSYSLKWPEITLNNIDDIIEKTKGCHCRNSAFKGNGDIRIISDFAMGSGMHVDCPTSKKFITVYFHDNNSVFNVQRFTIRELRVAVIERLNLDSPTGNSYEQLSLFEVI